ncbi:hypothetical protein ACFL27_27080 [candidate division CSSED10-310 bacterium]|uniref:Uncharacterized protein n=1 Tax=candidate division CSSED10-310 bacterium TaxID=2855610 RepID=A0ABV6Z5Z6_UNCC1
MISFFKNDLIAFCTSKYPTRIGRPVMFIVDVDRTFAQLRAVKRIVPPLLLVFWIVLFCTKPCQSVEPVRTIYFYSSETSINNFKMLKMEFDRYLSRSGAYEFQPFSDREIFEGHIKDKKNCLLILSSWHFCAIHQAYSLIPALIGIRDGKKYQQIVLVSKDEPLMKESLKIKSIVSAGSEQHTRFSLGVMLKQPAVDSIRILTVPKDIDALMSVCFGMSKIALATDNSLDQLKAINPQIYKSLNVIAKGEQSLLFILAIPENGLAKIDNFMELIKKCHKIRKERKL